MDLRFEYPAIPCRRLWTLIEGLPPHAAIRRRGKVWLTEHELAAQHMEQSTGLLRLIAQSLGVKFKGPGPEPVDHPDRRTAPAPEQAKPKMSTREEIAAFFDRVSRRA